ncbi:MAG: transferrin receptor-like dimerization domain-containing protein [Acidobacteriota bacterium]|nr:transferrin receptor-like dimerization domain-containing protein [Acidobacteriota bacterium]
MKRTSIRVWLGVLGLVVGSVEVGAQSLVGFTDERAAAHLDLESRFAATLDADDLSEWSKAMTPRPHHLGSPQAAENAKFMLELFRSWGFDAEIETFHVLFPTPHLRRLTLLEPTRYEARLQEEVIAEDATSAIAVETGLPPYNAYSADGDVTAELVYVNRGVPADYEELARRGIDVRGKIVIARYWGSWRGIKPKVAHEKGAIGCIIFNDPGDDGYAQGLTYPDGAYKHEWGVQRGSVIDLPKRPGDPQTPMRGSIEGAERIAREDADSIMQIPVLPISWRDAVPLLEALEGPVAPAGWRGALPLTYRIGPGPAKVQLELEFDWNVVAAHNVIARLEGAELPDEWIVRGNHHDAWVIGARDPISGMIALLAEAKGVGELARSGWRPRRTLVYAGWDGEEQGLLGSVEWAEHHAEELGRKAVVYINTDGNSRGFLGAGGSHALEKLVGGVASTVVDPQTGATVGDRRRARTMVGGSKEEASRLAGGGTLRLSALGSGSDYSPFLQHLGIASLNLGFGGEGSGGEYHTAFDSYDHYTQFVDPGFAYGVALAETAGRITLRLVEADVVPFDYTDTAATVSRYVDEMVEYADAERKRIEHHNQMVTEGHFDLAADPTRAFAAPAVKEAVPHLNFAPLLTARDRLVESAERANAYVEELLASGEEAARPAEVDSLLYTGERRFLAADGLPRRPWFRNLAYAPGFYTGYSVKTLPGVREGLEEGEFDEAQREISRVAAAITSLADQLDGLAGSVDTH